MTPRRRWAAAGLWVAAALQVGATPLAASDPAWLPIARPDGISVFVAVAFADTVLDTAIAALKGRMHPAFAARLDTIVGTTTGGQRVRLPGWEDPAGTVEGVLVPWAYGEDCRPIAWSGQLAWIPAGTQWRGDRMGSAPSGVDRRGAHLRRGDGVARAGWATDDPRWFDTRRASGG